MYKSQNIKTQKEEQVIIHNKRYKSKTDMLEATETAQ
jgi:flagellar assembly factor FliW